MPFQKVIGSYLLRFIEEHQEQHIHLQNLKTGEQLEFETWASAYCFLEQRLEKQEKLSLESRS
jgi:hypothetical protein